MSDQHNDRFLRLPDVIERTTLCRTVIYQFMKEDKFPKQIKLGTTAVWSEQQISQWIEEQKQAVQHG